MLILDYDFKFSSHFAWNILPWDIARLPPFCGSVAIVQSLSRVWLFCDSMDCSLPGSSVDGISYTRILEWVAISFSRWSSQPRTEPTSSALAGGFLTTEPPGIPCYGSAAAAAAKSLQLCPTLCNPIDGSLPGSPVPGILQARTLECVAISCSSAWKWKVTVKSLSRFRLLATPWIAAYQAPSPMGFSRAEYWTTPSQILSSLSGFS